MKTITNYLNKLSFDLSCYFHKLWNQVKIQQYIASHQIMDKEIDKIQKNELEKKERFILWK